MPDLIGLLRFGAPLPPANVTAPPPAPVTSDRAVASITASAGSSVTSDRNMGQRPMMGGAKPTNADAGAKSAALAPPAPMDPDIVTGPPQPFRPAFWNCRPICNCHWPGLMQSDPPNRVRPTVRNSPMQKHLTRIAPSPQRAAAPKRSQQKPGKRQKPAPHAHKWLKPRNPKHPKFLPKSAEANSGLIEAVN